MSTAVTAELVTNVAGRRVPTLVNGREQTPYAGVDGHRPTGNKYGPPIRSNGDYPRNGDKRVPDLETALRLCGLRDGMTISSHHHLRNGDLVALTALQTAARMGAKDLMWFPSASFPCHEPVIELMKSGAVHHIEGSMNGPLGDFCSHGQMRGMGVLRSHGGRWQAVQDGEVHIDIAVIAAPTADFFGNADGAHGKSACGSLGFALTDSVYADRVIVVTDAGRIAASGGLNNPSVFQRESNGVLLSQLITDFGRTGDLTESARYRAEFGQCRGLELDDFGLIDLVDCRARRPGQPVWAGVQPGRHDHHLAYSCGSGFGQVVVVEAGPGGECLDHPGKPGAVVDVDEFELARSDFGEEVQPDRADKRLGKRVVDHRVGPTAGRCAGCRDHGGGGADAARQIPAVAVSSRHLSLFSVR